ncbi:hypothetical protein [Demequina sp. NBRC 110054]|uniref:hypothetical protein n=1 Tax=Demequina sp. NBRC 110054 TaxID=1570343 RepID=UPI000A079878|nr:hypothetical protein [Demequina sp. NBRC 110054]
MAIPQTNDPRWQRLIDDPGAHAYQALALKIMMQRIARSAPKTPAERDAAIGEVHGFFVKNERLAAADLQTIFG